jgi:GH15 family glucan-1,4-alpha-glucosidase
VIGDGRSVALVAADGAIDWWAVPAMDAPPVFAALLDPETGGSFTVEPAVPYQVQRRYLPGTNVLETTFRTGTGLERVVDSLNRDVDGPLGWTELAREVRCGHGEVPMRWRVAPGTRFYRARPWAWEQRGTPLLRVADRVCDLWSEPDSGIWELGSRRHYTISKMACWMTLDRMIRLADRGQVAARDAGRWRAEAAAIHEWVDEHCWSQVRRSYSFYAGTDDLDASVLLAGRVGFVPGDDPRFGQTIDAIRGELSDGPLIYRYTGSREEEGAFLACSFWLVDALARAGRQEQAREVWKGVTAHAGDLGLLSEELDPATGELRGNLPRALSHLALISAACQLSEHGVAEK